MYRICYLAPGPSIHAKRWIEAMHERGHQVLWVSTSTAETISTRVRTYSPFGGGSSTLNRRVLDLQSYSRVWSKVREFNPDLVHLHYLQGGLLACLLTFSWHRMIVSVWGSDVVPRTADAASTRVVRRKRSILRRAREVTATTSYLAAQTASLLESSRSVKVIPFGVDVDTFRPSGEVKKSDDVVIGFVKCFEPVYGPDVLLEGMKAVSRRCPNARLVMRGFGDPKPYRRYAEELGVEHCVTIGGEVPHEEVPKLLQSFDIFCMPSRSESFGVAAIEASACRLPVVATRTGGIGEAVQDGKTGLLVRPSSAAALAEALVDLVLNRDRARRMGVRGREFVMDHFRWSDCVTSMEKVYDRAMSS